MNNIKFSIIVPIYNVEIYIEQCIESLINQSYENIEIILVDDGSLDNCPLICDKYASTDSRIRVFHKENGGLSDARNFGLKKAKGEYIIFVDSDDYIDHDACKRFKEVIYSNQNVDIIASNSKRLGDTEPKNEMYTYISKIVNGREFLKIQFKSHTVYVTAWRNIYRRKFIIDNQLFFKFGILHEDQQWTPRVFLQAESVITSDYIFYYHNIRAGSITQQKVKTKNALDIISTCNELKIIYEKLEDNELKKLLLDYLVTLYLHAFYIGKLLGTKYKNKINKNLLRKKAYSKNNKNKVRLFLFNEYIYYYYYYFRINYFSKRKLLKYFSKG